MKTQLTCEVLQVKKWKAEGNEGVQVYMIQDSAANNENIIGLDILKSNCELQVFEQCRGLTLPAKLVLDCDLRAGAKQATTIYVVSVNLEASKKLPKAS